jgi:hypothetical protein
MRAGSATPPPGIIKQHLPLSTPDKGKHKEVYWHTCGTLINEYTGKVLANVEGVESCRILSPLEMRQAPAPSHVSSPRGVSTTTTIATTGTSTCLPMDWFKSPDISSHLLLYSPNDNTPTAAAATTTAVMNSPRPPTATTPPIAMNSNSPRGDFTTAPSSLLVEKYNDLLNTQSILGLDIQKDKVILSSKVYTKQ